VAIADASFRARIKSLSRMGGLVELDTSVELEAPAVGTAVTVTLEAADDPAADGVLLHGQVVRVERSDPPMAIAVMFAPLPRPVLARIDALIGAG
jgi:hypothetical protein